MSSNAVAADPLVGRTIDQRFKIVSLLARGGMGKVYLAEQAPLGRACALKILNPNYAVDQDPEFVRRFFREANIASRLKHPNTVTIFDYGKTDDDIFYMAMEYLEGCTLHRVIRQGPLLEARAAHIAMQICRSLREAHHLGVIHRDLKPANVFLVQHADESDFVKVLDFGLVKAVGDDVVEDDQLTKTGLFMGSPKYMSPEQVRGDKVDARTDVYSLGIILYEMLCGRPPFERANSMSTLMAHVNDAPPPMTKMNPGISVTASMTDIVTSCLQKDPAKRFASMDELLLALKRASGVLGANPSLAPGSLGGAAISGAFAAVQTGGSGQFGVVPTATFTPGGFDARASAAMKAGPSDTPPAIGPMSSYFPAAGADGETPAPPSSAPTAPYPTRAPVARASGRKIAFTLPLVAAIAATLGVAAGRMGRPGSASNGAGLAGRTEHAAATAAPAAPATTAAATATATAAATATTATTAQAPAAATATPAAEAATTTADARVANAHAIATEPAGAAVYEDGKRLCAFTPCQVTFADDGAHRVAFVKSGFRVESRTVDPSEGTVTVRLTRGAPASSTPTGFKDLPY